MATKARKFKKKLAQKPVRKKESAVLSVNLIGKEYIKKVRVWIRRIFAFTMNHKPKANKQSLPKGN